MPDEQDTPTPEPTPEDALPEQEHDESSEHETEAAEDAVDPQDAVEEEDTNSQAEAAALAAAMAAINQVQGVADSAVSTKPEAPSSGAGGGGDAQPFSAPEFHTSAPVNGKGEIDLLSDVHMDVRIELGRTRMFVEDVLKLSDGAVVELDKLAGDPVDVFVNNRRVARGEVLVLNDLFCVRINEVVDIAESED